MCTVQDAVGPLQNCAAYEAPQMAVLETVHAEVGVSTVQNWLAQPPRLAKTTNISLPQKDAWAFKESGCAWASRNQSPNIKDAESRGEDTPRMQRPGLERRIPLCFVWPRMDFRQCPYGMLHPLLHRLIHRIREMRSCTVGAGKTD